MLGWTVLFGLMSLSGVAASLANFASPLGVKIASSLFALLFLASLLARAMRTRVR